MVIIPGIIHSYILHCSNMKVQHSGTDTFNTWIYDGFVWFVASPPGLVAREPPAPEADTYKEMSQKLMAF